MNRSLWIAKKNFLCSLIKKVSDAYGGDDDIWLREYAMDAVKTNKDDLGRAIICFESLTIGLDKKLLKTQNMAVKTSVCLACGYVPPFCRVDLGWKCTNVSRRA